jgi:hypothetical protein
MCIRRTKSMKIAGRPIIELPPCQVYLYRVKFATKEETELYHLVAKKSRQYFQMLMEENKVVSRLLI